MLIFGFRLSHVNHYCIFTRYIPTHSLCLCNSVYLGAYVEKVSQYFRLARRNMHHSKAVDFSYDSSSISPKWNSDYSRFRKLRVKIQRYFCFCSPKDLQWWVHIFFSHLFFHIHAIPSPKHGIYEQSVVQCILVCNFCYCRICLIYWLKCIEIDNGRPQSAVRYYHGGTY